MTLIIVTLALIAVSYVVEWHGNREYASGAREGYMLGYGAGLTDAARLSGDLAADMSERLLSKLDVDPDDVAEAVEEMQAEDASMEVGELEKMYRTEAGMGGWKAEG